MSAIQSMRTGENKDCWHRLLPAAMDHHNARSLFVNRRMGTCGVSGGMKIRVAGTNCYLPLDGQCNRYVGSESESVCH